jgi:hypothetical protein
MSPTSRRTSCAVLGLLILAAPACKGITEPSAEIPFARTSVTDAAALQALACGATHHLIVQRPYQSLRLFIAPDLGYVSGLTRADKEEGNRVTVLQGLQGVQQAWTHSLLHSLYALPGNSPSNHPKIFSDCGVLDL